MKQVLFPYSVSTYWWNFGKKKNDFNGTVSEWMKEKGIHIGILKNKVDPTSPNGLYFTMYLSSNKIVFQSFDSHQSAAIMAMKLFMTVLGDKATIVTMGRTINVNHK